MSFCLPFCYNTHMNQEYHEQHSSPDENNGIWIELIKWLFIFAFWLISSLSLSVIVFLSATNEWSIAKYYSNSALDFFLATFPFFWLLPVFSCLLIAIFIFKFTLPGKSLSFYKASILVSFLVVLFSLLFFYTGLAKLSDSYAQNFSFYEYSNKNRIKLWQNPEFGLLSGEIGTITDLNDFLLIDFNTKVWTIESINPKIIDKSIIETGGRIKLIGRKSGDNVFEAREIKIYTLPIGRQE